MSFDHLDGDFLAVFGEWVGELLFGGGAEDDWDYEVSLSVF